MNLAPHTQRRNLASQFAQNLVGESDFEAEDVTDALQLFIADTLAAMIDAGSERDVVIEDVDLHDALDNLVNDFLVPQAGDMNTSDGLGA